MKFGKLFSILLFLATCFFINTSSHAADFTYQDKSYSLSEANLTLINYNDSGTDRYYFDDGMLYICGTATQKTVIDSESLYGATKLYVNFTPYTDLSGLFLMCWDVTDIYFGPRFNTAAVTDMSEMFKACENLVNVNTAALNTAKVTSMRSMFAECTALKELNVSKFNTAKVTDMSGMFVECCTLRNLDLTNFNTKNVKNMESMFWGCKALRSPDFSKFRTGNVTDMSGMFYGCKSFNKLDLSAFDTSNVRNMSNMFAFCTYLTSVNLKKFNTRKVSDMHSMFAFCSELNNLDLSGFANGNVKDCSSMFECCTNLSNLLLGKIKIAPEGNMDDMFANCSDLQSLELNLMSTGKAATMNRLFLGCSELKLLNLNNFSTKRAEENSDFFKGCKALERLYIKNATWGKLSAELPVTLYDTLSGKKVTTLKKGDYDTTLVSKKATCYVIMFDGNGATSGNMYSQVLSVNKNTRLKANAFKKTGFSFVRWDTQKDGEGERYGNEARIKGIAKVGETVTLYAHWKANTYNVKFNANKGKGKAPDLIKKVTYGEKITLPKNTFTRKGYKFLGWSLDRNAGKATYKNKAVVRNLTDKNKKTVTLYAVWRKIK